MKRGSILERIARHSFFLVTSLLTIAILVRAMAPAPAFDIDASRVNTLIGPKVNPSSGQFIVSQGSGVGLNLAGEFSRVELTVNNYTEIDQETLFFYADQQRLLPNDSGQLRVAPSKINGKLLVVNRPSTASTAAANISARFFESAYSYEQFFCVLAVALAALLLIELTAQRKLASFILFSLLYILPLSKSLNFPEPYFRYFLFEISLASCLVTLHLFSSRQKTLRIVFSSTIALYLTFLSVEIVYFLKNGVYVDSAQLASIYQSNIKEAIEYIASFYSFKFIALFAASVAGFFFFAFFARARMSHVGASLYGIFFLLLVGGSLAATFDKQAPNFFISYLKSRDHYETVLARFKESMAQRKLKPNSFAASTQGQGETYVVVIGESHNRNHTGLYGYFRETSPLLGKRDDIYIARDMISTATHTEIVLPQSLTTVGSERPGDHLTAPSVIDLANSAGFATTWISNQNVMGEWDNIVSTLAHGAQNVEFINKGISTTATLARYDMDLVARLKQELAQPSDKNRLIILHLIGNHFKVSKRYPEDFDRFRDKSPGEFGPVAYQNERIDEINHYDTAVRYNDLVLSKIIDTLSGQSEPAAMLYFSDHSEDVVNLLGHDSSRASTEMFETPMFFWFNDSYDRSYPKKVESLASNLNLPLLNDEVDQYILDMAGIETDFLLPERSIFRTEYTPKRRPVLNNIDYDKTFRPEKNIVAANLLRARDPRIIPHRVNTLAKLHESLRNGFRGFEIDLMFNEQQDAFVVGHDQSSITGITLESYLERSRLSESDIDKIWLDVKNLNNRNLQPIIAKLNGLDEKYDLRKRVIFETGNITASIEQLKEAGYHVSYYLPIGEIMRSRGDTQATAEVANKIRTAIREKQPNAISFDTSAYDFVRSQIDTDAQSGMQYHVWDLTANMSDPNFMQSFSGKKYPKDKKIKTIIYPYNSHFTL